MDISPWDANAPGHQPTQQQGWADFSGKTEFPQKADNEKWADFSNKAPENSKDKENWADFSSFDSIEKR